ncbi:MAG: thymidylate synthase [Clostridiales bacterium]|jgi:thymidylate synthase|nr:thymidylate synthase [Clostridiales bacterium]
MSIADQIFIENCKTILTSGISDADSSVRAKWQDGTPAHTLKSFGIVNRYDLSKEFPLLTLRKTAFRSAVDELLWIWQKKSNKLSDLNSKIWDQWSDASGTIGKAYGYQLAVKYDFAEGQFDQVDKILYDLKNNPSSRRIMANMYNFSDLKEMNLYPCAYGLTLNVSGKRLNAILNQRSQDVLVANNWNAAQYAILVHMFARVSNLEAGELVHVIADAHIYDRHIPLVEKILQNPIYPAPTLSIDPDVKDFYKFTVDSFKLTDYRYTELKEKIPVAI